MIGKWLFSGALFFEAGSWATLWSDLSVGDAALAYGTAHGAASLLLCAAVWRLLPARYRRPLPWSPLFIFSLAFFVPILGALGVLASIFPALRLPRRHQAQAWQAQGVPALPFRPQEQRHSLMFGDGGLQDVLHHASDPERRLAALLATRRMPGREAVPILKLALRDPADDVRLLAYSMLDQKESRINQRIETALRQLGDAAAAQRGALHATLARSYWELAYLGLAQGGVLEHVLEQAARHVALAGSGDDAELHLLGGRIAMEQGNLEVAQEHLNKAREAGIDAAKLAPFHAEIAFLSGRYEDISALLALLPDEARRRPPFAELARYWA